jgi:glycosyltransferase involved in cell wall biosynthesis
MSSTPAANEIRTVLIVEPVFHVHTLHYCKAALASSGFENTKITLATGITVPEHRKRMEAFAAANPRLAVRYLAATHESIENRMQSWRAAISGVAQAEAILREEQFDLIAYMMIDLVLPFFTFRRFRRRFPRQWASGISGLVFRDHGLRPLRTDWKASLRNWVDRFILARAIRSPAIKRLSFFDPLSAVRAKERWGGDKCREGVDPMFLPANPPDMAESRVRLGVAPDAFTVLLFGSHSVRKGTIPTLSALAKLRLARPLHVLIGGPVAAEIREQFDAVIAEIKAHHAVTHHPGFVPDSELHHWFAASDTVMCAYKEFAGSSGILLHASAFGKPAIVSGGGVMGDAVRRYDSGAIVDLADPATIQAAVRRFAEMDAAARAAIADRAREHARRNDARLYLSQFL